MTLEEFLLGFLILVFSCVEFVYNLELHYLLIFYPKFLVDNYLR